MVMASSITRITMLSVSILFFLFPSITLSIPDFNKLPLPLGAIGPEALAFDLLGQGPYTGVGDGRILKYQGPSVGFQDYAFDTPNRSKAVCDGNTNPALGNICGRPLGIGFRYSTKELYIADAYLGLLVAGPNGRLAKLIANGAEGMPFRFPDGLDVDQLTGNVYFTDFSSNFNKSELQQIFATNDTSGRLLKYDPTTLKVTVLLKNLSTPAGVAVSSDGRYILFTEFLANRVQKYWLKGPKASTSEVLVNLQGSPDNIKRTPVGDFWVAVNVQATATGQTADPRAIRIDGSGRIWKNISLRDQYNSTSISEVHERGGLCHIGSLIATFVGAVRC